MSQQGKIKMPQSSIVKNVRTLSQGKEDRNLRNDAARIEGLHERFDSIDRDIEKWKRNVSELKTQLRNTSGDEIRKDLEGRVLEGEKSIDSLEQQRDKIGMELHLIGMRFQELEEYFEGEETKMNILAKRRAVYESEAAKKFLDTRQQQREDLIEEEREALANVDKKISTAKEERKKAAARIKQKRKEKEELLLDIQSENKVIHQKRMESILQLKHSTETLAAEIQGRNSKKASASETLKREQAVESEKILASGGNPYEVFRRREQEARVAAAKSRIEVKLKQSQMQLAQKMIDFDEYMRKKDGEDAKNKEYEQAYTKSLGRQVQERRVRDYMKSRTIGGVDTLDPSGREFRVEPSSVTQTRTHEFGLGTIQKKRKDIVEMISSQSGNKGVTPNTSLIPPTLRPFVGEGAKNHQNNSKLEKPNQQDSERIEDLEEVYPAADTIANDISDELQDERQLVRALPERLGITAAKIEETHESLGRYKLRSLSRLEQAILSKAKEEQKRNIVQDQIVWGKKYVGSGFLPKPEAIHFKDFVVGNVYTKSFVLTNVSYSFNSFKVLDLPEDVKNFFTVSYEKPGRMSAGMCCKVSVEFEPKTNCDITTEIPFLAKTGPFTLPIRCSIRKVKPALSKNELDFGTVVLGESRTIPIEISNEGSLETPFELQPVAKDGDMNLDEISIDKVAGTLAGYSKQTVRVTYTPSSIKAASQSPSEPSFECFLVCSFPHKDVLVSDQRCSVKACFSEVPIYTDTPEMDFYCCVTGKLYRNKLVLRNRGALALRVNVSCPKEISDAIEFLPNMGFVQGRTECGGDGSFEIQIKFRPNWSTMEWCEKNSLGDPTSGLLAVPILISVPDQTLPVPFCLKAQLTESSVTFSCKEIDFGECYVTQSMASDFVMTNLSALPQRFGFVKLKPFIQMHPSSSFGGTLLPKSEMTQRVVFSPTATKEYKFSLSLRTNLNQTFTIPCKGHGIDPPLLLSHTVLKLGATSVGATATQSVSLSNPYSESRTFQIILPTDEIFGHGLSITPTVGTLSPNQTVRLEIKFKATKCQEKPAIESDVDSASKNDTEPEGRNEETCSEKDQEKGHDCPNVEGVPETVGSKMLSESSGDEPWSCHCEWIARCCVDGFESPLFLRIGTTTIEPEIICDQDILSFQQVPVGHSKPLVLRIRNFAKISAKVSLDGVSAVGPFSIVNAIRDIPGQESHAVTIKFTPQTNQAYQERLLLNTKNGQFEILLCGNGVSPELEIEAQDSVQEEKNMKRVCFGNVYLGETKSSAIILHNKSVFSLEYAVISNDDCVLPTNFNGLDVFGFSPEVGCINAGGSQQVDIEFAPDQEILAGHVGVYTVRVPNQTGEVYQLKVEGKCWRSPLYLHLIGGHITPHQCEVNDTSFDRAAKYSDFEIRGTFDDFENGVGVINIGSCSSREGGTFEFKDIPGTIQIDKPKGTLKANMSETVRVSLVGNPTKQFGQHYFSCLLVMENGMQRSVRFVLRKRV